MGCEHAPATAGFRLLQWLVSVALEAPSLLGEHSWVGLQEDEGQEEQNHVALVVLVEATLH